MPAVLPLPGPLDAARAARRVAALRGPVGQRALRRCVAAIDWSSGRVIGACSTRVSSATIVIFTSDNGPWMDMPARMLVEPRIVRTDAGSAGPLRGSKGTTWEGGVRVPFLARWPGYVQAGSVSTDMATTMDMLPTIAAIVGAPLPAGRAIDGRDIRGFPRRPRPVTGRVVSLQLRRKGRRRPRQAVEAASDVLREGRAGGGALRLVTQSVGALGHGRRAPGHRRAPGRTHAAVRRRSGGRGFSLDGTASASTLKGRPPHRAVTA